MEFFGRESELRQLFEIEELSHSVSQFTVITGRRRIGKTELVKKAYEHKEILYFFVARKAEADLCQDFVNEIRYKTDIPMPDARYTSFPALLKFLMEVATTRHITLFIDEFQDFYRVNPSVFSDMQNIWDSYKSRTHINLIVAGSVNTLMNRIFKDEKESLFGRQTHMINVRPFPTYVLKEIIGRYHPEYTNEDLLALYALTGGVAKYIEMFIDQKRYTLKQMFNLIFREDSFFIYEGKNLLVEEFGKDYATYFSILSLISQGHNTRSDIEESLGLKELSGYLRNLAEEYGLIGKRQPLFEKSANKNVRYSINDQFMRFWFRFIFKYSHIIEAGGIKRLQEIAERDYPTFSGYSLECYFREKLRESGLYTRLGYWHDRKGENEIDLIAEDVMEKRIEVMEVKRNARNIDIPILRAKAETFLRTTRQYQDYTIKYIGLSIDDM